MTTTTDIPLITVSVMHYRQNGEAAGEDVDFKIYREDNLFRAIPLMSREERLTTGLPEVLEFAFASHCITRANDMEEETLNAIKQIVQELEVQDLL
jgi:hypothetical protein